MRHSGAGAGNQLQEINQSVQTSSSGLYQVNDLDDGTTVYVGKTKVSGHWVIEKFVESTGVKSYANVSNNGAISGYTDAWTNRATLTYGRFDEITGY